MAARVLSMWRSVLRVFKRHHSSTVNTECSPGCDRWCFSRPLAFFVFWTYRIWFSIDSVCIVCYCGSTAVPDPNSLLLLLAILCLHPIWTRYLRWCWDPSYRPRVECDTPLQVLPFVRYRGGNPRSPPFYSFSPLQVLGRGPCVVASGNMNVFHCTSRLLSVPSYVSVGIVYLLVLLVVFFVVCDLFCFVSFRFGLVLVFRRLRVTDSYMNDDMLEGAYTSCNEGFGWVVMGGGCNGRWR